MWPGCSDTTNVNYKAEIVVKASCLILCPWVLSWKKPENPGLLLPWEAAKGWVAFFLPRSQCDSITAPTLGPRERIDLLGLFPSLISMPISFPLVHRSDFSAVSVFTSFKACDPVPSLLCGSVLGSFLGGPEPLKWGGREKGAGSDAGENTVLSASGVTLE